MKSIKKMIEKFGWRRLEKSVYGKAHDVIIGEWIRWWLTYSRLGDEHKRRVINPGVQAYYRKKRYTADLLFCERDNRISKYKILGVAEIENNKSKCLSKITSLRAYEKVKTKRFGLKFPHLKFAILCTRFYYKPIEYGDVYFNSAPNDLSSVKSIVKKMQNSSANSSLTWILYILKTGKYDDNRPDEPFLISNRPKDYEESFKGKPDYFIIKNGTIRSKLPDYWDYHWEYWE